MFNAGSSAPRAVVVWQLKNLKTEPLLDPLRNEPRFQALERELKFRN